MIGESIPAGTTTALGVLTAMGYEVDHKMSGSTPENPHKLKHNVVNNGLKLSGYTAGELKSEPFIAIDAVGDPMIPAVAGIAMGSNVPVTLAGGTQMTAVCAVIKGMCRQILILLLYRLPQQFLFQRMKHRILTS